MTRRVSFLARFKAESLLHRPWLPLAACVCLLVAAAALRFYDLPGNSIWFDEAVVADNSSGSLREVVANTRVRNSSPALYPLALWVVQKVDVSPLSIRLLPATASVLTVAAMLFLLPRLGVPRGAAFLAALMTALSVEAIYHAQDAREYSIDALLVLLMTAGLLWYLRDGRKSLLCLSLFLAPLLQYGLALFGVAVIGAAVVLPAPVEAEPERGSFLSRVREWLKARAGLVWPAGAFLAGCAITYAVTLRYHLQQGSFGPDGYLSESYYQGEFYVLSLFEFSVGGTWSLLTHHLPVAVAIAALAAGGLLLIAAELKRFRGEPPGRAIAVLFSFCIVISVAAALLGMYPLGDIRQNIYLGPVIFLAAAVVFHWTAGFLASLTGRGWAAPALVVAAAGAIVLAGVVDIWRDNPYEAHQPNNIEAVLAVLEERVEEGDMVYVNGFAANFVRYYQDKKPGNYHYGEDVRCWNALEGCLLEMVNLVVALPNVPNRIFVVHWRGATHGGAPILEALKLLGEETQVEGVIAEGDFRISLIGNAKAFIGPAHKEAASYYDAVVSAYDATVSGEPAIRSDFNVYLRENRLVYAKEPCARADTEATFFLALYPVDVKDLPDDRREHGFDNLDFPFARRGMIFDGRCMATVDLPEYAISEIKTGQYTRGFRGLRHLWEAEFPWREGE